VDAARYPVPWRFDSEKEQAHPVKHGVDNRPPGLTKVKTAVRAGGVRDRLAPLQFDGITAKQEMLPLVKYSPTQHSVDDGYYC
jgi:hypothetical protein